MRKYFIFLILVVFLCFYSAGVHAQSTYYYKCTTSVDANGVRSAINNYSYWTIVGGQFMYMSDKNGNKLGNSLTYRYKCNSNNAYYFPYWNSLYNNYDERSGIYLLVTGDFVTINEHTVWGTTLIWKQTTPQAEADNLPGLIE